MDLVVQVHLEYLEDLLDLVDLLGLEYPEDLQDLALSGYDTEAKTGVAGGFTYDDLYRWSSVFEETNGTDGSQHDDFHAISADYGSIPLDAFPYAWDLEYLVEEADGTVPNFEYDATTGALYVVQEQEV